MDFWHIGFLIDWLIDFLIDRSIDRSIDRLIDWMIDWLENQNWTARPTVRLIWIHYDTSVIYTYTFSSLFRTKKICRKINISYISISIKLLKWYFPVVDTQRCFCFSSGYVATKNHLVFIYQSPQNSSFISQRMAELGIKASLPTINRCRPA